MRTPDTSRRIDRAGQTIEENGFRIRYDEYGYFKSSELISESPGYIVNGQYHPGEPIKRNGKTE